MHRGRRRTGTTITAPHCATKCCCEGDWSDRFDWSGCPIPAAAPAVSCVPPAVAWGRGLHGEFEDIQLSLPDCSN